MGNKVIFVFCEGIHDVAFLSRLMKANGLTKYNKKLKEYPEMLKNIILSSLKNESVENFNIENIRYRILPSDPLIDNYNNIYFFYSLGGDSKKVEREKYLKQLYDNFRVDPDPNSINVHSNEYKSYIIYFLDADDQGIKAREDQIKEEIASVIKRDVTIKHNSFVNFDNVHIGLFVFSENGKDTGRLEEFLLPMMRMENDDIFSSAESFLNGLDTFRLFKHNIVRKGDRVSAVFGTKYDYNKALIGTIGQLHFAGSSNTVCIKKGQFLNNDKILKDDQCKSIFNFLFINS